MTILAILLLLTAGCALKPSPRVNFDCRSYVDGGIIITNCADEKTWREWAAKQKGET